MRKTMNAWVGAMIFAGLPGMRLHILLSPSHSNSKDCDFTKNGCCG